MGSAHAVHSVELYRLFQELGSPALKTAGRREHGRDPVRPRPKLSKPSGPFTLGLTASPPRGLAVLFTTGYARNAQAVQLRRSRGRCGMCWTVREVVNFSAIAEPGRGLAVIC